MGKRESTRWNYMWNNVLRFLTAPSGKKGKEMITAQLIDVGRNKVNKTVTVKSASALHKEIQKCLFSKGWGMDEVTENEYIITAGWATVGTVKIISAPTGDKSDNG